MNFSQVKKAQTRLREHLAVTRMTPAPSLSRATGAEILLKLESELPTGSFKPRGALWALLQKLEEHSLKGVVASSTGNHGAAVAYAAKLLGLPVTIFLPANPNPVKRARIAELGAEIVEAGKDISDAFEAALATSRKKNLFFLNDASDPNVPCGTATIGCEIAEQAPGADVIFVPVGDTALIRGVAFAAKHLKPDVKVIGVQAERAPSYTLSWREGRATPTDTCDTIADGLATRTPLEENVTAIRDLVDDMVLVSEEELLGAVRRLEQGEHITAEPAGAASTAALLASKGKWKGKTATLLVTGSNLAPDVRKKANEN